MLEGASPAGTIDAVGKVTISGPTSNPTVSFSGQARLFPSYTGYVYTKNEDGSVNTVQLFQRDETVYTDLPKPMTPLKSN